jgi:hypothetical protein
MSGRARSAAFFVPRRVLEGSSKRFIGIFTGNEEAEN